MHTTRSAPGPRYRLPAPAEAPKPDVSTRVATATLVLNERARRGWSAAELARRAGVSPMSISRLEAGYPVSRETVDKALAALAADETEVAA